MDKIKRYSVDDAGHEEDVDGEWCHIYEVEWLEEQLEELKRRLSNENHSKQER